VALRLLDTSVAVDHLRGHDAATQFLEGLLDAQVTLLGSELVRFELLAGVRAGDEPSVERFLEAVDWIPVSEPVARQAATYARAYRHSHSGIDDVDYLIAATATVLDAPLLTTNLRHFPMFKDLGRPY
jgi:predicted nucleic acid-binding protein